MPKPYSYDFRQKVIEAIELNGLKKSVISVNILILAVILSTYGLDVEKKQVTSK